jgi:hypothetical protein
MRFDDVHNLRLPGLLQPMMMDRTHFGPDQVTCVRVLQVTGKRFTQGTQGRVVHGSVENADAAMCWQSALAAVHVYAITIQGRVLNFKDPVEFNKLFLFGTPFTYPTYVRMITRALKGAMYSCFPALCN